MHTKHTFNWPGKFEVKSVPQGCRKRMTWRGSTDDLDRENEIVPAHGWETEEYMKRHPEVYFNHKIGDLPIAKTVGLTNDDKGLIFEIEFVDEGDGSEEHVKFAQGIRRMCESGFLTGSSVSFWPMEPPTVKDMDGKKIIEWGKRQLVEFSIVTIPANPHAVMLGFQKGILSQKDDPPALERIIRDATRYGKNVDWADQVDEIIAPMLDSRPEEKFHVEQRLNDLDHEIKGMAETIGSLRESLAQTKEDFEAAALLTLKTLSRHDLKAKTIERGLQPIAPKQKPGDWLKDAIKTIENHTT